MVVTSPSGEVVVDQYHLVDTTEPGVVVDAQGNWSVELQLRDADGQPTGEPFPELGVYTVQTDCVTTYQPRARIPYNDVSFEVVETVPPATTAPAPPSTTPTTPEDPAPAPGAPDAPVPDTPAPATPVVREPDFTG